MNLSALSAVAEGLSSGLLMRQRLIKSENSLENLSDSLRVGGGFVGIMNIALMGCTSAYGGRPSAISIAVIPRDQISARQS